MNEKQIYKKYLDLRKIPTFSRTKLLYQQIGGLMDSVFGTLLTMPLFQGMEEKHLWNILGKAKMNFLTLRTDDVVLRKGNQPESIIFLIKGTLQYKFQNIDDGYTVTEYHRAPMISGLISLFGLYKNSPYTLSVTEESSVLKFPKDQFFEYLRAEPLLLLNYINYISARVQRPLLNILSGKKSPVYRFISNICATVLNPGGIDPVISIDSSALSKITGLSLSEISEELDSLADKELIKYENNNIHILSRQSFIHVG